MKVSDWPQGSSGACGLQPGAAAAVKSLQSYRTLCDPIDGSPPGFPIPGILQARTLEWVTISFSNAWKWKVKGKLLSGVWFFTTPWTAAYQAPPPMGFSEPRVLEWVAIAFSCLQPTGGLCRISLDGKRTHLWVSVAYHLKTSCSAMQLYLDQKGHSLKMVLLN